MTPIFPIVVWALSKIERKGYLNSMKQGEIYGTHLKDIYL